jgi:hypothetical protein
VYELYHKCLSQLWQTSHGESPREGWRLTLGPGPWTKRTRSSNATATTKRPTITISSSIKQGPQASKGLVRSLDLCDLDVYAMRAT